MQMTPKQLKAARDKLGISTNTMATWIGVSSGRSVRRWEASDGEVPGWVAVIVTYWLRDQEEKRWPLGSVRCANAE